MLRLRIAFLHWAPPKALFRSAVRTAPIERCSDLIDLIGRCWVAVGALYVALYKALGDDKGQWLFVFKSSSTTMKTGLEVKNVDQLFLVLLVPSVLVTCGGQIWSVDDDAWRIWDF
ncbi:hypothetical protein LWI29_014671 [Acer saccharum]|uniref:Uncharacterized protein n=1 Tax=Acer saccharum TaxID=4024 RepID=A0AA39SEA6_ACESA|nr:hypothetical protein LWI29_014671 [Acer saccharum]